MVAIDRNGDGGVQVAPQSLSATLSSGKVVLPQENALARSTEGVKTAWYNNDNYGE